MKSKKLYLALLSLTFAISAILGSIFAFNGKNVNTVLAANSGYSSLFEVSEDTAGSVTFTENKKDFLYNSVKGLGINVTEDTTLILKNKVNVKALTKDLSMLEFYVDPVEKGKTVESALVEITNIDLRIENWDNPNEYVEIQSFNSIHNNALSWATTSTHAIGALGINKGEPYLLDRRGTPVKGSYSGNNEGKTISLRYDNTLVTTFAYEGLYHEENYGGYANMIRTLNKSSNLLNSDVMFQGFTCDYVRLTVKLRGISNANGANVIFTKLLGQPLTGANDLIEDTVAPTIYYDINLNNDNVPLAEINTSYPLFSCVGFDAIDGDITTVKYDVYYTGELGDLERQPVISGYNIESFTPNKLGKYEVDITIKDSRSNSVTETITVTTINAIEVLKAQLNGEIPSTAFINEVVNLPSYELTGGSGTVNENLSVYAPNGEKINVSTGNFVVTQTGSYKVQYTFTDYLGKEFRIIKQIRTELSKKPVISLPYIQKYLKKDNYIVLNQAVAHDYTSYIGQVIEVPVQIFVSENDPNGEYVEVLKKENDVKGRYIYTPSANATSLYIKYRAIAKNDSTCISESIPQEVKILTISENASGFQNIDDYFYINGNIQKEEIAVNGNSSDKQIYFSVQEKGASLEFINGLRANGLSFKLNFDSGLAHFNKITVVLSDSASLNQVVSLSIEELYDNIVSYTTLAGDYGKTAGLIKNETGKSSTLRFTLNTKTKLIDANGDQIINITKFDNGEKFVGFTSGKVHVKLVFNDFDESESNKIRITEFYSINSLYDGAIDLSSPIIETATTIPSFAILMDYVTIPSAIAIDDLSPNCDTFVKLRDPDGNYVLGSFSNYLSADLSYEVFVNKPGKYILEYMSFDESEEKRIITYVINTMDTIVPKIEIDGQIKSTYSIGEALYIPEVSVIDNVNELSILNYYVYLDTPNYSRKTLMVNERRETYVFKDKGDYKLIFFAIDESGNSTQKTFKITVK